MSIEMHFVNSHTIMTANSDRGKWKIPTRPGFARFFKTLKEAKKWAKDNQFVSPTTETETPKATP